MQSTSALYNNIVAGEHEFQFRLIIDGVGTFGEDQIESISTSIQMFDGTPDVGKAVAGEVTISMLLPNVAIPKMAVLRPQTRAVNATQQSEWIPQGVYYIDTRERTKNNDGLNILTIHGYDAMLRAEQMYAGRITGNSTDIQMVNALSLCRQGTVTEKSSATSPLCMSGASSCRTRANCDLSRFLNSRTKRTI